MWNVFHIHKRWMANRKGLDFCMLLSFHIEIPMTICHSEIQDIIYVKAVNKWNNEQQSISHELSIYPDGKKSELKR